MLVAESRLSMAANADPLRENTEEGADVDGRIRWRSSVTNYETPDTSDDLARVTDTSPTRLYRISVDVRFPGAGGRERTLTLSTLKIGARNPANPA